MNWQQILQLLNTGVQTFNTIASNPLVQTATGAGLLGAGLAQKEEPGYATEAVQYLRNRLGNTGLSEQFSGQIGALNAEYLPYLEQQRNQLLDQTQQRFTAGQPSSFSTAMSGPEIGAIRNAITNQILPGERAHIADIGQYLLTQGGSAAGTLLNYAKPDPLGGYLASLGMNLLGGRGGQAGQTGQGTAAQSGIGKALLDAFGGNTSIGDAISQAVGLANTAGDTSKLAALLSSGILKGTPFPIGLQASTPAGQVIKQAINAGLVEWPAAIPTGAASGGGLAQFLGSSLGTVLGLAGIAAGGYGIGGLVSNIGQNQFQSSAGGALGGAAAGALAGTLIFPGVGTAIGAIVGGLGGFFGGLFGERSEQHAQKEAFRQEDLSSQADQVQEIGSFFNQRLAELGIDTSAFQQFISQQISGSEAGPTAFSFGGTSGTLDQQQATSQVGGALLLQAIQRTNPSITSLSQVPGLKQAFIDFLTRTTTSASNSAYASGPALNQFAPWASYAGLARGGYINRPNTLAVVGEAGPELAILQPNSMVIPFKNSLN